MDKKNLTLILDMDSDYITDLLIIPVLAESSKGLIKIKLTGSINTNNTSFFQSKMDELIDRGFKSFIFDMSKINYVSAMGIGVFIHIYKKFSLDGGTLILNKLQNNVLDILDLPGFSEFFHVDLDNKSAEIIVEMSG